MSDDFGGAKKNSEYINMKYLKYIFNQLFGECLFN